MLKKSPYILYAIALFVIIGCNQSDIKYNKNDKEKSTLSAIKPPVDAIHVFERNNAPQINMLLAANKINLIKTISDEVSHNGVLQFTTIGVNEGLPSNLISSCYDDSQGNLWLGTFDAGVVKFDGINYVSYSLSGGLNNVAITCIVEDNLKNIWFGTNGGGVCKYDGQKIVTYTTVDGLPNNNILCIKTDHRGALWIGTLGGGLCKLSATSTKNAAPIIQLYNTANGLPGNEVHDIVIDKKNNLWLALGQNGYCQFDGQHFIIDSTITDGKAVQSIFIDTHNNLWLAGKDIGMIKHTENLTTKFNTEKYELGVDYRSIKQDKLLNIWAATSNGLIKISGKNSSHYATANGLANNNVYGISLDVAGNLWCGTYGGGLSKYKGASFVSFITENGLANNQVISIFEDNKQTLWFGTKGGGISNLVGNKFFNYAKKDGSPYDIINCIVSDADNKNKQENIWFGTAGAGLLKYDGQSFTNYTTAQGLANNQILCSLLDKKGNLWFGTNGGGVSVFDGRSFNNFTESNGLLSNTVNCMVEDQMGNIWFATNGNGLCKFNGQEFASINGDKLINGHDFLDMVENTNLLNRETQQFFLATTNGLMQLTISNKANHKSINTKLLNKTNGLPDNYITTLAISNDGKIIVGTRHGIALFNPNLPIYSSGKLAQLEVYNDYSGYQIKEVLSISKQNATSTIWFGTNNPVIGLVKCDKNQINKNYKKPVLKIDQIEINNQPVCWHLLKNDFNKGMKWDSATIKFQENNIYNKSLTIEEEDSIKSRYTNITFTGINKFNTIPIDAEFPYRLNNLKFEFSATDISNNNTIKYQYKLVGYDTEWSQLSLKNEAAFGNINEGNYTLLIRCVSGTDIWSDTFKYNFKILPPWYQTWWAYLISILLFFTILYLAYKRYVFKLKQDQRYLEGEVIERTLQLLDEKKEVEKQKMLIEEQKGIVDEKQKQILDSIFYAKRIQDSILVPESKIVLDGQKIFVFYKPKDIVSGDFYWYNKTEKESVIIVADCTGHGVPGAFLSMVGSTLINEIVTHANITDPAKIIKSLAKGVATILIADNDADKNTDGMDISIVKINHDTNECNFASVNQSIYVVSNNQITCMEAQVNSILGLFEMNQDQEINSTIYSAKKGDMIYLCTDGYADQQGAETGKNYYESRLEEFLLSIHHLPINQQKEELESNFIKWQGSKKQTDDVLIIGIKIN